MKLLIKDYYNKTAHPHIFTRNRV